MTALQPRAESAHYYDKQGNPQHTIVGATTGRQRSTTLRDAKKHGWVPSVTTILKNGLPTPYGLELWRLRMLLDHALTTERGEDETDEAFVKRIQDDYESAKAQAPDLGTEVHALIADYLRWRMGEGEEVGPRYLNASQEAVDVFLQAKDWIDNSGLTWLEAERTVVTNDYAGTIDAIAEDGNGHTVLLDWKTQAPKKGKVKAREDWAYQLAAYETAYMDIYSEARCLNVILPTDGREPVVKEWSEEELYHAWRVFAAAKHTYYLTKWGQS